MLRKTLPGGLLVALTAAALAAAAEDAARTAEWPQWRGPRRDGVSRDTGLLQQWPEGGPPLLWEARGAGEGYASIAVAGGRVYTIGDGPSGADEDEYAVCFDEATGKQLWRAKLGPAYQHRNPTWGSPRSTPTVDGDVLYALTPQGDLVCLETAGGRDRWRKNLRTDFGGRKGDGWAYSESVLIDGEKLICSPGGPKATMMALNKKTGESIWTASVPGDRGAGHASPMPSEVGGTAVYVQTSAGGAFGVRAEDGKLLWTYPIERTTAVIPTPIVRYDLVFFSAGYGRGGALLRQVPAAGGEVKVEEVYGLKTELNNRHGGVILVGEFLYGDTDSRGQPWCAEFLTGNVRWKGRGSGRGSAAITYADNRLYLRFQDGTMVLAEASPEAYREVSAFKIPHSGDRPSWSIPVVAGGKLFLREGDHVLCYDVRAK